MQQDTSGFYPLSVMWHKSAFKKGPGHAKTCLMPYANNKGADQLAHPRSMISIFVFRCLDSLIWAATWQNQQNECAPSYGSDQPGHPPTHFFVLSWGGSYVYDSILEPEHDKTCLRGRMRRLICAFVVCIWHKTHFLIVRLTCYIQSIKNLAGVCSWAGWCECYLVENPGRHVFARCC